MGFAELLAEKNKHENATSDLKLVMSNAQHLLELVDHVMDISRIEANELNIKPVKVQVSSLLTGCINAVKVQALQKGLHLTYALPANVTVFVDVTRFRQIVINLLSNAIKFTCGRIGSSEGKSL